MSLHTYRVWMKDGYASLHNADNEQHARELAISQAIENCKGAAMSERERCEARTVDYVEKLS